MISLRFIQIYAITAGSIFLFLTLRYSFSRLWHHYFKFWFYKFLYYPFAIRRRRWIGPVTWLRLIIEPSCWLIILALPFVNSHNLAELGANFGTFALIFLGPLVFGGNSVLACRILDVSLRLVRQAHVSLGLLTLALILTHAILLGTSRPHIPFTDRIWLYGLIVRCLDNTQ